MLDWREEGAQKISSAPLLLVPVELRRGSDRRCRLHPADNQEPLHDPALSVKLDWLGVDWNGVNGTDVSGVSAVIEAARAVADRTAGP
ncbi:DUF4011 domain-containing protein [Streptomyces thermolilacinus]|nr:DUF4011 domain-containing protein [Streptomyces thermolilacinus]